MGQDARKPIEPSEHLVSQRQVAPGLATEFQIRNNGQKSIPGLENPFGIQLEERFFQDIRSITSRYLDGSGCNYKVRRAAHNSRTSLSSSCTVATAHKVRPSYRGLAFVNSFLRMTVIRDA